MSISPVEPREATIDKDEVVMVLAHGSLHDARPSAAFAQEHGHGVAVRTAISVGHALMTVVDGVARTAEGIVEVTIGVVAAASGMVGGAAAATLAAASVAIPAVFAGSATVCLAGFGGMAAAESARHLGLDPEAFASGAEIVAGYGLHGFVASAIPSIALLTCMTAWKQTPESMANHALDALKFAHLGGNAILNGGIKIPAGLVAAVGLINMETAREPLQAIRALLQEHAAETSPANKGPK